MCTHDGKMRHMSDLEQWSAARLLVTARRRVEHAYSSELAGLGLSHAGLTILTVLAAKGAFRQIQLAEELKVQSQTLGKMLNRLARKGFVSRRPHGRSQMIAISPGGQDALSKARGIENKLLATEALCSNSLRGALQGLIQAYG